MNKSKINSTNMKKFNLFAYATLAGLALSFAVRTTIRKSANPARRSTAAKNAVSNLSF